MSLNLTELAGIRSRAEREVAAASSADALDQVRVRFLGRNGVVTQAFRQLGAVPPAERPSLGAALNDLKTAVEELVESRRVTLQEASQ